MTLAEAPSVKLKYLLSGNRGGVWGEDASGDGDSVVLRSTEQTADGRWQIHDPALRSLSAAERRRFRLVDGDVLVTKSSGSESHIGKATLVDSHVAELEPAYSNFMQRLRPGEDLDPRFLWYLLQSSWIREQLALFSTTTTGLSNLTGTQLGLVEVPLLDADGQRAIADYLDRETAQIDAFIAKNEDLIALLTERRAATITSVLTSGLGGGPRGSDYPWYGAIPATWESMPLRYLLQRIEQGVSPQTEGGLAEGKGQFGVLKSGCVNGGAYRPTEHKLLPDDFDFDPSLIVHSGDLLVNRASGSVPLLGSAALVTKSPYQLILSDKTFRLVPSARTTSNYLYWLLNSRIYREQVESSVSGADGLANNLPQSSLRRFVLPVPPREEQDQIDSYLTERCARIDKSIDAARRGVELARERRAALISAAVTGKIDVGEAA